MLLCVNKKNFRAAELAEEVRFRGTQIFFAGHLLCAAHTLYCLKIRASRDV